MGDSLSTNDGNVNNYNRGGIGGTKAALAYALNIPAAQIGDTATDNTQVDGQVTVDGDVYNLTDDTNGANSVIALTKAKSRAENPLDSAV